MATTKPATHPKRCMSPFWIQVNSVLKRNQVGFVAVLACCHFGFVAVLETTKSATYQNGGVCRRFGCVTVFDVAILDVLPFWHFTVLDVSPF